MKVAKGELAFFEVDLGAGLEVDLEGVGVELVMVFFCAEEEVFLVGLDFLGEEAGLEADFWEGVLVEGSF